MKSERGHRIRHSSGTERILGYAVRYSARAKRLQIRIRPWVGVEIVAPHRCSTREVERFVRTQRSWIERTSRTLPSVPPVDSLPSKIILPALSMTCRVRYGLIGQAGVAEEADALHVPATPENPSQARNLLRAWLAAKTRTALLPRLDTLAHRHGFSYCKVNVRGQRTRWGSCSSRKNLSINYKLLFLVPDLVDYLFVHELAHTRHLNHSARFWLLVERCLPDYREMEARMSQAWRDVPGWVEAP